MKNQKVSDLYRETFPIETTDQAKKTAIKAYRVHNFENHKN
jgi:hypothetical protein